MTISRRLTILLAIPLLALVAFGVFVEIQIGRVEVLSRFVVDMQIQSVASLEKILRRFAEGRIEVRQYLLSQNSAEQERAAKALRTAEEDLNRLSAQYGEKFLSSDEDRRLWNAFQDLHGRWSAEAGKIISMARDGNREAAIDRMFSGIFPDLGLRTTNVLDQWVDHNEHLATTAGNSTLKALTNSRRNLLMVVGLVLLLPPSVESSPSGTL